MKVGRSALDEDAIRLIEESHPAVEFDWTRILKGAESDAKPPAPFVERRKAPRAQPSQGERLPQRSRPLPAAPAEDRRSHSSPTADEEPALEPQPSSIERPSVEDLDGIFAEGEPASADVDLPLEDAPATAAHARLGAEGVMRLRARYSEVLARISERVSDTARQEQLKSEAERLNPDTWVTDDEVRAGLEGYETVFESLRMVVGRRRRRRSRGGGPAPEAPASDVD